ncbi:MAG TPA: hybrid sensor histidine kinase/response regulator [Euryarchaeota archaeon]|nr:hybrid sensor histidine kinase/response regulator [Euryarchaeota archaeon]
MNTARDKKFLYHLPSNVRPADACIILCWWQPMKILTVDDRKDDLYLLNKMLEGGGHEVIPAANGREALSALEKAVPDLVISDILMPEMDGYQLLKEVKSKEELKDIPFVFYTATYTSKKDEDFAYSLGASRFIVKPQGPDEFIALVDKTVKDQKNGILASSESVFEGEEVYLKEYNKRLIEKLEDTVTQLEEARSELKGSWDFLDTIISSIDDGILVIDESGKVELANKKGRELESVVLKKVIPTLESGGRCTFNSEILLGDRCYDPSCFSTNIKGRFMGTTIVLRDVTDRRNVQEELRARIAELEKWQKLTVGREIKMVELKKQVKELESRFEKLGKKKGR